MRKKLIDLREKMNLGQKDVASKIGISRPAYSMIESGKRNPSFITSRKIKEFFKTNEDSIFDNSC
ncbi:putative transcriptional regulator [Anaerobacterium chartisolvens]|uniref:Putative transcriptional regulator n=1 Tax=Anaerobacterium chartisolvens TaxID=1297424 RepID=A0A369AH35_9FIRM|nr:helix-turn-helix transcriptional regulator [Anaerobacterium chartisolvens]RCX08680.1 putative transcriptional regulator [Anaerobacterium chartisolvens]